MLHAASAEESKQQTHATASSRLTSQDDYATYVDVRFFYFTFGFYFDNELDVSFFLNLRGLWESSCGPGHRTQYLHEVAVLSKQAARRMRSQAPLRQPALGSSSLLAQAHHMHAPRWAVCPLQVL